MATVERCLSWCVKFLRRLAVSSKVCAAWIRDGELAAVKVRSRLVVRESDLAAYISLTLKFVGKKLWPGPSCDGMVREDDYGESAVDL